MFLCFLVIPVTHLAQRKHHEGSPTAGVYNHGHKLGVNGAEIAVPGHLGDSDVIVALVGFHSLAKDVTELAGPHNLSGHGELRKNEKQKGWKEEKINVQEVQEVCSRVERDLFYGSS